MGADRPSCSSRSGSVGKVGMEHMQVTDGADHANRKVGWLERSDSKYNGRMGRGRVKRYFDGSANTNVVFFCAPDIGFVYVFKRRHHQGRPMERDNSGPPKPAYTLDGRLARAISSGMRWEMEGVTLSFNVEDMHRELGRHGTVPPVREPWAHGDMPLFAGSLFCVPNTSSSTYPPPMIFSSPEQINHVCVCVSVRVR